MLSVFGGWSAKRRAGKLLIRLRRRSMECVSSILTEHSEIICVIKNKSVLVVRVIMVPAGDWTLVVSTYVGDNGVPEKG